MFPVGICYSYLVTPTLQLPQIPCAWWVSLHAFYVLLNICQKSCSDIYVSFLFEYVIRIYIKSVHKFILMLALVTFFLLYWHFYFYIYIYLIIILLYYTGSEWFNQNTCKWICKSDYIVQGSHKQNNQYLKSDGLIQIDENLCM